MMFSRLLTLPDTTSARSAVLQTVGDVRLPERRSSPEDVPAPGEAVIFEYGGFLDVKTSLNWGYALTGTESLEAGALEAASPMTSG